MKEACNIMTEKQLAEYLNVSVYTVRQMRLSEGLPVLKFDNMRATLYYRPAVEDWLSVRSLNEEKDTAEEEKENGKGRRPKYGMAPIPD